MKKKIASMLVKWAMKLNPDAAVQSVVPVYEEYDAKAIGIGREITKNDIKHFKRDTGEKSTLKAVAELVKKVKSDNLKRILDTASGIVEETVYRKGEHTVVESRLNVYVKKAYQGSEVKE